MCEPNEMCHFMDVFYFNNTKKYIIVLLYIHYSLFLYGVLYGSNQKDDNLMEILIEFKTLPRKHIVFRNKLTVKLT